MKKLLISVAVLGLLAGAPALAQDDHHHGHGQGQGQGAGGGNPHNNGGGGGPAQQGGMSGPSITNGAQMQGGGANSGRWQGNNSNRNNNRRGNANNWQGGNWQGNANSNWQGNNRGNRWRGNTWRGNNGVTVTGRNWTSPRRFNAGVWRGPRGWTNRRWRFGEFLPATFFLSTFWLTNFATFDLPPPPPGLVWVRSGPDALLVDRFSGEIVQVVYNVFW